MRETIMKVHGYRSSLIRATIVCPHIGYGYGVNEGLEIANASIIAEKCAAKSVSAAGLNLPVARAQSRMIP